MFDSIETTGCRAIENFAIRGKAGAVAGTIGPSEQRSSTALKSAQYLTYTILCRWLTLCAAELVPPLTRPRCVYLSKLSALWEGKTMSDKLSVPSQSQQAEVLPKIRTTH